MTATPTAEKPEDDQCWGKKEQSVHFLNTNSLQLRLWFQILTFLIPQAVGHNI